MVTKIIEKISPYYAKRAEKKAKGLIDQVEEASHTIGYDSGSETLEPVYFFILDLMNEFGLKPEKLVDNFTSSPGSGHFGEIGQKRTMMQQQGAKLLGDINTVLRSLLNLLYDLKEFRIRLESYKDLKSSDKSTSDAARLSLKQIWLDKVDIQKGNSSLKAMALGQGGFVTLLDAFLAVKDESLKDDKGNEIDLNERVKRVLRPRILEFNDWLKKSESELSKRYEIEKTYLRSQFNSLKLYARWAKPYLKAANELEENSRSRDADLVKTFNTLILELTLLGKRKLDVKGKALEGDFPIDFSKEKFLRQFKRDYYMCVLTEFRFRSIPQKVSQQGHFAFGGKVEVTFKSYALNEDELKKLDKELENSDLEDSLKLIKGITEESIEQIKDEIDYYLKEDEIKEESKKKSSDQSNPFVALIGGYNEKPEKKDKEKSKQKLEDGDKPVMKDNWFESNYFRKFAAADGTETIEKLFDIYKKAHGMASYT